MDGKEAEKWKCGRSMRGGERREELVGGVEVEERRRRRGRGGCRWRRRGRGRTVNGRRE